MPRFCIFHASSKVNENGDHNWVSFYKTEVITLNTLKRIVNGNIETVVNMEESCNNLIAYTNEECYLTEGLEPNYLAMCLKDF